MSKVIVTMTSPKSDATLAEKTLGAAARETAVKLVNFLDGAMSGCEAISMSHELESDSTSASASVEFSANVTANDTLVVNGITFTAVASGATGNQFNIETDTTGTIANLVVVLGAEPLALVSAVAEESVLATTGVMTVTAVKPGAMGNAITIAEGVDFGGVISVSGARLSGGADAVPEIFSFGA